MERTNNFLADLWQQILAFLDSLVEFLPNILGALALLFVAWLIALALRALSVRILGGLNHLLDRVGARGGLAQARLPESMIRVTGGLIFLIALVFGLEIATRVLEVEAATRAMDRIIEYVPTLIAGLAILILGLLVGSVLRNVVTTALAPAGPVQAAYAGRVAQAVVLVVAVVMALDQIEIDVRLPISLIVVIVGTALGGLSLAFGLGARGYTANLIAGRQIAKEFKVGETIRFDEIEGVIAEIAPSHVVLDGASGRTVVPASHFLDTVVTVVERKADGSESSDA